MNEYKSEMTINGECYEVRALTIEEYLEVSRSAILKALTKAPFEIKPQNIKPLAPNVVFGLMSPILFLTSRMLATEIAEFEKVKRW